MSNPYAAQPYRYATTLSFGQDGEPGYTEVEVEVSYTVAWGSPETGRGYLADPAGYDPGSPDLVEDIKLLTVEGKPSPWDMGYGFISDAEFEEMVGERLEHEREAMLIEARDIEADRYWTAMEDRAERRAEDLREGF